MINYLVGGWPTLLKIMMDWKSVGIMTFPTAWNNKKCSKPTTSIEIHEIVADILYLQVVQTNQLMGVNHAATAALTTGARRGSFWSYGARIGHGRWIKKPFHARKYVRRLRFPLALSSTTVIPGFARQSEANKCPSGSWHASCRFNRWTINSRATSWVAQAKSEPQALKRSTSCPSRRRSAQLHHFGPIKSTSKRRSPECEILFLV